MLTDKVGMAFPLSKPPSLVIFDCDGVLVDTEPSQNALLADMIRREGLDISDDECRRRYVGGTMEMVAADLETRLSRALDPGWIGKVIEETVHLFEREVKVVPGVERQVRAIRDAGIAVCVASSGKPQKMKTTLGVSGLAPLFDGAIFDASMVARGKPAPDLFLHAAREMGHAPETCVVVEDSLFGVEGAVAAGMPVLGYAGDPHTDAEGLKAKGAHVFHDMSALIALLGLTPVA